MRIYCAVTDALPTVRWLAIAVALIAGQACGDDDEPADSGAPDTGQPEDMGADAGEMIDLGPPGPGSWRTIYAEIIRPQCSCHLMGGGEGGLEMRDAARAYEALVGVMAQTRDCNDGTRVIEGDAAASVLYRKVSGEDLCGPRMPLGRDPLSQEDIDRIRTWIDDGARND